MKATVDLFLIAAILTASAQTKQETAQFQKLYDRAGNLMINQDRNGLVRFIEDTRTADYTYVSIKSGRHTLKETLQSMAMVLSTFRVTKSSVHIDKLQITGSTAVASITTTVEFTTRPSKSKRPHSVGQELRGLDVWVKRDGKWKLKLSKVTSEAETREGKPVPVKRL
jgi:hypothetical protein